MTAAETIVLLICMVAPLAAAEGDSPWREDFPVGLADTEGKPIALLFSSPGCHWCDRMIAESADSPEVRRALVEIVGFHVHADQEPALTAQLGIEGFPTLVLVNRKGELVRAISGYQAMADLATILQVLALHGDEEGIGPAALRGGVDVAALSHGPDAAAKLVKLLGIGQVKQRQEVRAVLSTMPGAADLLWTALDDTRLGVRVDAAAALAELVGAPGTYDAFAPAEERRASIAEWRASSSLEAIP